MNSDGICNIPGTCRFTLPSRSHTADGITKRSAFLQQFNRQTNIRANLPHSLKQSTAQASRL